MDATSPVADRTVGQSLVAAGSQFLLLIVAIIALVAMPRVVPTPNRFGDFGFHRDDSHACHPSATGHGHTV